MNTSFTEPMDGPYVNLADFDQSAFDLLFQPDDEALPDCVPEDSATCFSSSPNTTPTTEWMPTTGNPCLDFIGWPNDFPLDFNGSLQGVMESDDWRFNLAASPFSCIYTPFNFQVPPSCFTYWPLDFTDIDSWPLSLVDGDDTQTCSKEPYRNDVAQEAILDSPKEEHYDVGHPEQEMIRYQKGHNKLGKRRALTLESPSQTQERRKRRKTSSATTPRKEPPGFNFSVEIVEWKSQKYAPVSSRGGNIGRWKGSSGDIVNGKDLLTLGSEVSFQIRPNLEHLPVWMRWDEGKKQFRGQDPLDGHVLVIHREVMVAAVSERTGCYVGEFLAIPRHA